jgi:hypothetical protein
MKQTQGQRFRAIMPHQTHRREATCEEVDCRHYLKGWKTIVGTDTPQAVYIRKDSGREFTEMIEGGLVTFIFPPGQTCFRGHSFPTGRPPIFMRARPGQPPYIHTRGEDWIEDFGEELARAERMKEAIRG